MKKRVLSLLLTAALAMGVLAGCGSDKTETASGSEGDDYQEIELIMAVNGTDIQIDARVADQFAALVEEETKGRVTISVYPNDQLAGGN